jgi:hypothetical protein
MIPVKELLVDRDNYQRWPDEARVREIVEHYDPIAFGVLFVNLRGFEPYVGQKFIFDGQNRYTAARDMGMDEVPCILVHGLSLEEEARRFVTMDTNRRSLSKIDKYRANLVAKDPLATLASQVIEESGFKVETNPKKWRADQVGYIRAIDAVETAIRRYGPHTTIAALQTCRLAWPNDVTAGQRNFVLGTARLIFKFEDKLNVRQLQKKLALVSPREVIKRANALSESMSWRRDDVFGNVFYKQYLYKTRGAKLPDWNSRKILPSGRGDGSMQLTYFQEVKKK